MRLALRLGRTRRELLATISADELLLWRAFDQIDPVGDIRHDLNAGTVAATIANYAGRMSPEGVVKTPFDMISTLRRFAPKEGWMARLRGFLQKRKV